MKLLFKRAAALWIDGMFFGLYYYVLRLAFLNQLEKIGTLGYIVLFVPLFLRDVVFKNASIGKKIMGLAIFDYNWNVPTFLVLVKRSIMMLTVGYFLFLKALCLNGNYIELFDWERDFLKTRVVESRVLKQLKEKSATETDFDPKKMTELYDEYIRSIK